MKSGLRIREGEETSVRYRAVSSAYDVEAVDPLNGSDWDQLLGAFPNASCFHSSAWARVLNQTYGHRTSYLRFNQVQTVALLPLMEVESRITGSRGICLPFSDSCPALFVDDADTKPILAAVTELAGMRRWKYCEIRGGKALLPDASPAVSYHRHTLDLRDGADLLATRFSSSVRRAIRKAEKSGLAIEIASSEKAVRDYYQLHIRTRQRHAAPPQPLSFFLNIQQEILSKGHGAVVLARSKDRLAAGAIFFRWGGNVLYKFGASDERLQNLRANNLVMWEAIRFFARGGCTLLDFGRTSLHNYGLRQFKRGWATQEERLDYFAWDPEKAKWVERPDHTQGFAGRIFRRLPITVNRIAGTMLYPHLD